MYLAVFGVLLSSHYQAHRADEIVIFVVPWHCSLSTVYTYVIKPEKTRSSDLGSGFHKSNLVGNRYYDYPPCLRADLLYAMHTFETPIYRYLYDIILLWNSSPIITRTFRKQSVNVGNWFSFTFAFSWFS